MYHRQDKEKLLTKEIEQRYQQMQCDAEKEAQDIAEKDKWDKIHLQSLKSMVGEKDVERQLKRLKNQHVSCSIKYFSKIWGCRPISDLF